MTAKKPGRLTTECDELRSFVVSKANTVWIWQAKDIDTKEVFMPAVVIRRERRVFGILFPVFIVNALSAIQISGLPMGKFFHLKDIALLTNKVVKQLRQKVMTT